MSREPLGRQIASDLRHDIVLGRLPPGTRLVQHQLCDIYGTSRMPVRDALNQLEYEGFIDNGDTRRPTVVAMSRNDLEDIYLIEGFLHGVAARRATVLATPDDFAELRELHRRMQEAAGEDDPQAMAGLNWHFHRHINRMARSPKLLSALRAMSLNIPREFLVQIPEWMERANEEHEQILAAMAARDADEVENLINRHVREAGSGLIKYFEETGLELR